MVKHKFEVNLFIDFTKTKQSHAGEVPVPDPIDQLLSHQLMVIKNEDAENEIEDIEALSEVEQKFPQANRVLMGKDNFKSNKLKTKHL